MTTLTVGNGQQYATLTAAVAVAHTGDTINVQAGTYTNDFPGTINGLTIQGVNGIATFVATAQPGNGKAILDVSGNTTLRNLDLSGVTVPDGNGAAIRYEGGNLVISNTAIHGNQDGLLGAADSNGTISIDRSEIYGNGTGSGSTHNLYIGDIKTFTLTNSYVHDANVGHEVKSRAENNIIQNNRIEDNNGTASYGIDLPNGGNATISGNVIQKSGNSGNPISFTYGEEYDPANPQAEHKLNAGTTVTITGNTFVSDRSNASVLRNNTGANFTASNNTVYNYAKIDAAGQSSSNGFTTTGSRPTLDTSSPVDRSGGVASGGGDDQAGTTPTTGGGSNPGGDQSGGNSGTTPTTGGSSTGTTPTTGGDQTGGSQTGGSQTGGNQTGGDQSGGSSGSTPTNGGGTTPPPNPADTTAPSLSASQSVSGTTTSTGNNLSGTITDSGSGVAAVEIFASSNGRLTDLGAATVNGSSWSYAVTNLTPGTYQFYAVGTDKAGNATSPVSTGAAETVLAAPPPSAAIKVTGLKLSFNGVTLSGTATPNGTISLQDTPGTGATRSLGSAHTDTDGTWAITTRSLLNPFTSNTLRLVEGNQSSGAVVVGSPFSDTLAGTTGKADLFAFTAITGKDVIKGFETTATTGSSHDVIDLIGTRYDSFAELKSHISGGSNATIRLDNNNTITLTGVNANTLQASDFRFG